MKLTETTKAGKSGTYRLIYKCSECKNIQPILLICTEKYGKKINTWCPYCEKETLHKKITTEDLKKLYEKKRKLDEIIEDSNDNLIENSNNDFEMVLAKKLC